MRYCGAATDIGDVYHRPGIINWEKGVTRPGTISWLPFLYCQGGTHQVPRGGGLRVTLPPPSLRTWTPQTGWTKRSGAGAAYVFLELSSCRLNMIGPPFVASAAWNWRERSTAAAAIHGLSCILSETPAAAILMLMNHLEAHSTTVEGTHVLFKAKKSSSRFQLLLTLKKKKTSLIATNARISARQIIEEKIPREQRVIQRWMLTSGSSVVFISRLETALTL